MNENKISVGILPGREIRFRLNGSFRHGERAYDGEYSVTSDAGTLLLRQGEAVERLPDDFLLEPGTETDTFDLAGVVIGTRFHWERAEEQRFRGALSFVREGEEIVAVNILSLEDYLTSVISSEMNANAPPEFLKAHAVISRGWLLAQREKKTGDEGQQAGNEGELVRWFDCRQHSLYDVCADDHCQRYQGVGRENAAAAQATRDTRGEVLLYDGKVCDTRFSKCCGGVTERFDTAWEDRFHPYLVKVDDRSDGVPSPDLRVEENARAWILSTPAVDCNAGGEVLAGVLNDYDRETRDFFRWTVTYPAGELSALVESRLHAGLGDLLDLQPVERGVSGRIVRLRLVGTRGSLVIGKELLIRRALSRSHLYSSAFVVTVDRDKTGHPSRFILRGAGWGHGVGLCQIGAAVMSARGYSYREILSRYFPGTRLTTIY
ncbi:MAG: SpoIID/LytB domain-containing protein [Odoribacteraceae bacterium]|jgi:peptidoglycan hydrolase-like amidase|nr:SpoIID/LytB domain-containing protein [Odoribacteraceae bacterium]